MDSASHLLFGATLAGLSFIDPVVAHNPEFAQAVMVGVMVGSSAPDFDSVLRLKGFSHYIRYHRGLTHSLPAMLIWPALISFPIIMAYHCAGLWLHLYGWILLSVLLHTFLDLLNSYGTQCFRPWSNKWHHKDVLAIFDPVLFLLHAAGLGLWLVFDQAPAILFSLVYALSFLYIFLRFWIHKSLVKKVLGHFRIHGICHVLPDIHWSKWSFVVETDLSFLTGKITKGRISLEGIYPKEQKNQIVEATMGIDGVRAFLGFAQRVHVTWKEIQDGYEVKWSDVRFWYDRKLPFGVDVRLNRNLQVTDCTFGWRKRSWEPPFV